MDVTLLLLLSASLGAQADSARGGRSALPDAATLLRRHLEASGGAEALRSVKAQTLRGRLLIPASGLAGTILMFQRDSGERYYVVNMPGAGKTEGGNNGTVEWERSTLTGPKLNRVAATPGALLEPNPQMLVHWQDSYRKLVTVGTESVDNRRCHNVELTPEAGAVQLLCFDAATGLLAQWAAGSSGESSAARAIVLTLGDYRSVGALKLPFRVETRMLSQLVRIEVEEMKLNEELPAAALDLPEDIQELVRQRWSAEIKDAPKDDPDRPILRRGKKPTKRKR